jgi:hypothetical protein
MPRYFFAVRAGDSDATERAAELSDDAAALAIACEIVRELTQASLAQIGAHWSRSETRRAQWCSQYPSLWHAPKEA